MTAALTKTTVVLKPREWDGQSVKMPGIVSGVPLDTYHSDCCVEASISSSGLRQIWNQSPAHYWCQSPYNPDRIEDDETDALTLGRAAHHLLFGEKDFREIFTLRPASINGETWHGSKTACKLWLEKANADGLTVITSEQLKHIKGMAISLAQHPLVKAGLLNGLIEHSIFAKDRETGLWLKARPDCIPTDSLDMADLKTTTSVDYQRLVWSVRDYAYQMQAGLLNMLCRAVLGQPLNSFSLCFVEKTPPYCVRVVTLKDNEIDRGERQCRAALRMFADCMKANHWPGPGGDQQDAEYLELDQRTQEIIDARLKEYTR